jgi:putative FmdB family regulatory protein
MPIYEYECDKCGHEFEREQRIADPPVKTCPQCKGRKVTKLISRSSFVLKGGGWYADGYADAKKSDAADKASEPASGGESSESGSSGEGKDKKPTGGDDKKKSKAKSEGKAKESSKKSAA